MTETWKVLPTAWLGLEGTTVKLMGAPGGTPVGLCLLLGGSGRRDGLSLLIELMGHSGGGVGGRGGGAGGTGLDDAVDGFGVGGGEAGVVAELDGGAGAGVDGAGVHAGKDGLANDVRDEKEDDLVFLSGLVARGEEVFEKRQLAEAGGAVDVEGVLTGDEAGEEAGFAVFELNGLLGGVLPNDRLGNAGDGGIPLVGGDLDLHFEGYFAVVVDGRGDIDHRRRRRDK